MSDRTRAGSRQSRYRSTGVGYGRVAPEKISWLRTEQTQGQWSVHAYDPTEVEEVDGVQLNSEEGINYVLFIPVAGRRSPLTINCSNMTFDELNAMRMFFNNLFDLAEPVCRQRDKVASDAEAQGDFTYNRIYRAVPQFVVRERQERPNRQGVHDRSEDAPAGSGDDGGSSGGVRRDGDELAHGHASEGSSQDHESSAD